MKAKVFVYIALLLIWAVCAAGCNKNNENGDFCSYLNAENMNKTIPFIDNFLSSLPDKLDDGQRLDTLAAWLKSQPCICEAVVLCQLCINTPISKLSFSSDEKDFILDVSANKVEGFHDLQNFVCDCNTDENFYYCYDEKIFVQLVMDKIFLKFALNTTKEQLLALISSDASLQLINNRLEGQSYSYAVLESKDGNLIPAATLESFKEREEVVSATYLCQPYGGGLLHSIMDFFKVRLTETTTLAQLQKLAEQNHCSIIEKDGIDKYNIYVPKSSPFNSMQMANCFYETGLFEWATPNMMVFNALH